MTSVCGGGSEELVGRSYGELGSNLSFWDIIGKTKMVLNVAADGGVDP